MKWSERNGDPGNFGVVEGARYYRDIIKARESNFLLAGTHNTPRERMEVLKLKPS